MNLTEIQTQTLKEYLFKKIDFPYLLIIIFILSIIIAIIYIRWEIKNNKKVKK